MMSETGDEPVEADVEGQREADPEAPGLGVVDDEDPDPPEPNERLKEALSEHARVVRR